ncbi:MAG: hypothetical protein ABEH38_08905 [Flavobacteriales bacterium]
MKLMLRKSFHTGRSFGLAGFLIALIPLLSCEKEPKDKNRIYKDELKDTSNVELITSDTAGLSCPYRTPEFRIDKENDLLKFLAVGYEGRAVAKFPLGDLAPELQDAESFSVKLRFKGEFDPYNHRFGGGPIIQLSHDKVYRYDPSQEEVIEQRLEAPNSLTIKADRALSNFKVRMDGEDNVTQFFALEEPENEDDLILTVGVEGGSNRTRNCDTAKIQLDAIEVFVR